MKKILFVIPDYTPTTLRSLKIFHENKWKITVVVPFNINSVPDIITSLPIERLSKIKKRKILVSEVLGNSFKEDMNVISLSIPGFIHRLWKARKQKGGNFRDILQKELIERINFSAYDAIYCFDTVAYAFQKKAKEKNVISLFESRGPNYQFSLETNGRINEIFQTDIPDIRNSVEGNKGEEWWYRKLTEEPNQSDFMICYSNFHKEQFIRYNKINEDHIFVLPLPATIGKIKEIKNKPENTMAFTYVGNLSYIKGIPIMLKAWQMLMKEYTGTMKLELNLYGKILIPEIKNMIEDSVQVNYHGPQDHNKIMDVLKMETDVFVFPSLCDTFGFALLEALQLNVPVVTNYTNGAAELIEDGTHAVKYKDSFSIKELMVSMKLLADEPEKVEELSKNISQLPSFDESYMNKKAKSNIQKLMKQI